MAGEQKKPVYELLLDELERKCSEFHPNRLETIRIYKIEAEIYLIIRFLRGMIVPEEYYNEIVTRLRSIATNMARDMIHDKNLLRYIRESASRIQREHKNSKLEAVQETTEFERLVRS